MSLVKSVFGCALACALSATAQAECQDLKTTQAIVDYVCDYALVSDTQCNMWREDMRQMHNNTEIIVDSFISWNRNEPTFAEQDISDH